MEECRPGPPEPGPPARHCFRLEERAPDFRAPAYFRGREIEVSLGDFRGRWLLLFFYASDFTFV